MKNEIKEVKGTIYSFDSKRIKEGVQSLLTEFMKVQVGTVTHEMDVILACEDVSHDGYNKLRIETVTGWLNQKQMDKLIYKIANSATGITLGASDSLNADFVKWNS